jgi:hypothetical protein
MPAEETMAETAELTHLDHREPFSHPFHNSALNAPEAEAPNTYKRFKLLICLLITVTKSDVEPVAKRRKPKSPDESA